MPQLEQYRPSGRFDAIAMPLGLAGGVAVAGAGAFLYQFAVDHVPFIYVNALLTLVFGGAVGAAAGLAMRAGKCRHVKLAATVGVLAAVAGVGCSFAFAYQRATAEAFDEVRGVVAAGTVSREDLQDMMEAAAAENPDVAADLTDEELAAEVDQLFAALAEAPGSVEALRAQYPFADYVADRVTIGWALGRSGDGLQISGVFVWLTWLLELLLVAGLAAFAATRFVRAPFCEPCGSWTARSPWKRVDGVDPESLAQAAAAGDTAVLFDAPPGDGPVAAQYDRHTCAGCDASWVTVTLKKPGPKKGQEEAHVLAEFVRG